MPYLELQPQSKPKPNPERLVLASDSAIDTTCVSTLSRRMEYVICTKTCITTLFRCNEPAGFEEFAKIHWKKPLGSTVTGKAPYIQFKEKQSIISSDFWLKSGKGLASSTRVFYPADADANGISCIWNLSVNSYNGWNCKLVLPTEERNIGRFIPARATANHFELIVYTSGRRYKEEMLLSSILLATQKSDWKTVQSADGGPSVTAQENFQKYKVLGLTIKEVSPLSRPSSPHGTITPQDFFAGSQTGASANQEDLGTSQAIEPYILPPLRRTSHEMKNFMPIPHSPNGTLIPYELPFNKEALAHSETKHPLPTLPLPLPSAAPSSHGEYNASNEVQPSFTKRLRARLSRRSMKSQVSTVPEYEEFQRDIPPSYKTVASSSSVTSDSDIASQI